MSKEKTKSFFFSIMVIIIIIVIIGIILVSKKITTTMIWIVALIIFIWLIFKLKIILQLKDYERAVIFRFGKVVRVGGPGWTLVLPLIEKPNIVTLRVETIDIPPQNVLTKDNIQLTVDGVLFISIKPDKESVVNSVVKVEDYRQASTMYVIAALRDVMGDFELTEVITNIEKINANLKQALIEIGKDWGIKVTSVELSEIKIPQDILEAMHQQKAAVQKKLAIYELAESEKAKILAVKDATDQLSDKTVVYYYLKALEKMAEGQSSKIIFPMELTSLLEKVTTNLGKTTGKLDPNTLEKGINEKSLEKFLPFIQGYINSEKNKKKGKVIKKK